MWDIAWVWAEAFLRWLHVIAGIGWIGSSFYFIHLDYSLKQREGLPARGLRRGLAGARRRLLQHGQVPGGAGAHARRAHLVQVGGLRHLDLGLRPGRRHLLRRRQPLSHRSRRARHLARHRHRHQRRRRWCWAGRSTTGSAARRSAATRPCWPPSASSSSSRSPTPSTRIFSARGAFMQIGALIGTIMAANVLMVIIPGQRKVVADLIAGRTPDPVHGRRGKQRSTHNNYLTLPVVFVMISGPLSAGLRHALELGDPGAAARHGRRDPPLLQHAPPGPAEPVVDLGRGGRLRAADRLAVDARAGAGERPRAKRADAAAARP